MNNHELRRARKSLGLTVKQFGEAFGVKDERTIRGWENGERGGKPSPVPEPVALLVQLALEYKNVREWLGIS